MLAKQVLEPHLQSPIGNSSRTQQANFKTHLQKKMCEDNQAILGEKDVLSPKDTKI
jgi:hypothetical protein